MNKLKVEKKEAVISALVEGNSIRSIERMTGVHRDTVMRVLVQVGAGCQRLLNDSMRGLTCQRLQVDELWTYVGKKQNRLTPEDQPGTKGDVWTFVAIDADTKLVPCYHIGDRSTKSARTFLADLAARVINRCQLSADALAAYVVAAEEAFGKDVDFGQIVKVYEAEAISPGRYSPPRVISAERKPVMGMPEIEHISTSFVERQNLTMRMSMRRFTRLTNAFSKKLENLKAAVALHFVHYNFARMHRSLRATPALVAGVSDHIWSIGEIAALGDQAFPLAANS